MISIIIASVNPSLLANLKANIAKTIGIDYEIIATNNSKGNLGLCEIYNQSTAKAKYDLLCFMHEDVLFITENWGLIVADIFSNNSNLGLIGIAGSKYKSAAPSTWHSYEQEEPCLLQYNLLQHYKFKQQEQELKYANPTATKLTKVATVDGVWLCCTKEAYNYYPFDDVLLKGFHGYDLDFSLGISQRFDVAVTFEVLLEHFSEGNTNKDWLIDILKVHYKWMKSLPVNLAMLPIQKVSFLEKRGFKNMINLMKKEGFNFNQINEMLICGKHSKIMTAALFIRLYFNFIMSFLKRSER